DLDSAHRSASSPSIFLSVKSMSSVVKLSSHRECAADVLIGGQRLVAGDGRVVDRDGPAWNQIQTAADTDAGGPRGASVAVEWHTCNPARVAARAALADSGAAAGAGLPGVGHVLCDQVIGLELL